MVSGRGIWATPVVKYTGVVFFKPEVIIVCSKIHKQQLNSLAGGIKCKKHGSNIANYGGHFLISQQKKVIGDFSHHH